MRRLYKIEVAAIDGSDGLVNFEGSLSRMVGENRPGRTFWSVVQTEDEPLGDPLAVTRQQDPRSKAIEDQIDKMTKGAEATHRLSMGGRIAIAGQGGRHEVYSCILKADRRDVPEDGTHEVFNIEAHHDSHTGQIVVTVNGPWLDSADRYWVPMAKSTELRRIVTPDWVHRTVSPDDPKAVASGGGGHGGAEFRFKIDKETADRFKAAGLTVISWDSSDDQFVVVTKNCWYQGVIPPKHRHLFKVNAEMVKGFNPGRYDI